MANFLAQEWLNKNITDKNIRRLLVSPLEQAEVSWKKDVIGIGGSLTGDLIIQDFPQLKEIGLREHELTSLVIVNCPLLEHINVRNNKINKLDIEKVKTSQEGKSINNEIAEIIAGGNELTTLNLTTCSKIKELLVADNLALKKIENLNFSILKNLNFINTLVSFSQDTDSLKQENDNLYEIIRTLDEAGQNHKFVFAEAIKSEGQIEEAINQLLKDTEISWREYLERTDDDPNIAKKKPLLDLSFRKPEVAEEGRKILIRIIEAQTNKNYVELAERWSHSEKGKLKYNAEYDYDGSLDKLINLLSVRELIRKKQKTKPNTETTIPQNNPN